MWLSELVWRSCTKWFSGQYIKNCMCSALQQWCNNLWMQEWRGIIGFPEGMLFQRSYLLSWFSPLFVKSCCVMWLSSRFASYAACMHEYSIIKHEQHAFALSFSLTPSSLHRLYRVQQQRHCFHPLAHLCYMWNFLSWGKTITVFLYVSLCILFLINWSSETEAKLQLSLGKTWCVICLKKIGLEFIIPCVLRLILLKHVL